jgi:hypothetical protein
MGQSQLWIGKRVVSSNAPRMQLRATQSKIVRRTFPNSSRTMATKVHALRL